MKHISKEEFFNQLNSCEYGRQYLELVNNPENHLEKKDKGEIHHIYMRAICGKNSDTIKLSYFNHIIAHCLLAKVGLQENFSWKYKALRAISEFTRKQINSISDIEKIELEAYNYSELRKLALTENGKQLVKYTIERWSDEENHKIMQQTMKDAWSDPIKRNNMISNRPEPWNKGKKMDDSFKEKCKKNQPDRHGKNGSFYGKHHTIESRKKIGDAHLGKEPGNKGMKMSKEFCEKCRASHLGKTPWNKGKKMDDSFKEKCKKNQPDRSGKNNPFYGHTGCWASKEGPNKGKIRIYKDGISGFKLIFPEELPIYIANGYHQKVA